MASREELFAEFERCLIEREDAYEESNRWTDKYMPTGSEVRTPMFQTSAARHELLACVERIKKAEEAYRDARNNLMNWAG